MNAAWKIACQVFAAMKAVLLVDDNTSLCHIIADLLRDRSYEVREATAGKDAVQLVRSRRFDVVIADLLLSGELNGIDVLALHNRLSPEKQRILFTAFQSRQLPNICAYIGARYLPKPASLRDLIRLIEGHS
ncbi:MAG TPA: response regulator [Candidatus Acidoferrales bacterium]|nr:response regulator [Candidatus Acidoferrales bacterium]